MSSSTNLHAPVNSIQQFIPTVGKVHPEVNAALANALLSNNLPNAVPPHVGSDEYRDLRNRLKPFFGAPQNAEIFTMSGAGTDGIQSVTSSLFQKGADVVAYSNGRFGDQWIEMAKQSELKVHELYEEDGPLQPQRLRNYLLELRRQGIIPKGVFTVHNETSNGILNPIEDLAETVASFYKTPTQNSRRSNLFSLNIFSGITAGKGLKFKDRLSNFSRRDKKTQQRQPLFCVDSVSGIGVHPLKMGTNIHAVVTSSQKGLGAHVGQSIICLSEEAIREAHHSEVFSLDLRRMHEAKQGPIKTLSNLANFSLLASVNRFEQEGLDQVYSRHDHHGRFLREELTRMGFKIFSPDGAHSNSVVVCSPPPGIDATTFQQELMEQHGYEISFGVKRKGFPPSDKSKLRIGIMGERDLKEISDLAKGMESCLARMRHSSQSGRSSSPTRKERSTLAKSSRG